MRPKQAYRIYNTWMGDPSKMIMLKAILHEIEASNLLNNVTETGSYLLNDMRKLCSSYPHLFRNPRGVGKKKIIAKYSFKDVLIFYSL